MVSPVVMEPEYVQTTSVSTKKRQVPKQPVKALLQPVLHAPPGLAAPCCVPQEGNCQPSPVMACPWMLTGCSDVKKCHADQVWLPHKAGSHEHQALGATTSGSSSPSCSVAPADLEPTVSSPTESVTVSSHIQTCDVSDQGTANDKVVPDDQQHVSHNASKSSWLQFQSALKQRLEEEQQQDLLQAHVQLQLRQQRQQQRRRHHKHQHHPQNQQQDQQQQLQHPHQPRFKLELLAHLEPPLQVPQPQIKQQGTAGNGAASADDDDDEKELLLLLRIQNPSNGDDVLRLAHKALSRLNLSATIAALHMAARHLSPASCRAVEFAETQYFKELLHHLRSRLSQLKQGRSLSRLCWTLGKFDVHTQDVEAIVEHICTRSQSTFAKSTAQDLTNMLWGLARLFPSAGSSSERVPKLVAEFAASVLGLCAKKMETLSAQCLSNGLWAVARLRLRSGKDSNLATFMNLALSELSDKRELRVFTPQGIANTLWALAELHSLGMGSDSATMKVCQSFAAVAKNQLNDFQPQELSMLAWAIAKIHGRAPKYVAGAKCGRRGKQGMVNVPEDGVDSVLVALASEARKRLADELSAQSISNIAWALATRNLLGASNPAHAPARAFMVAATAVATEQLATYAPQAVANILWAVVRLDRTVAGGADAAAAVQEFAVACAKNATLRMLEFTWRDLAGVSVAFAQCQCFSQEVMTFMTLLVGHAAYRCAELSPQAMLNIAQSATRLRVSPQAMQPMVDAIARLVDNGLRLNDVDMRQWQEAQQWCAPGGQTGGACA